MKIRRLSVATALSILALSAIAVPALANTITVKPDFTGNFLRIQDAIDAASNGDEVVVYPGIYTGAGNMDIDFKGKAITVRGSAPTDPAVIATTIVDCLASSGNKHRGFYFHSGEGNQSILAGLTITHGYAVQGGGILVDASSPTIAGCVITANACENFGAGIFCNNGGSPIITHCVISSNQNNTGPGLGGGIACMTNSNPTVQNCVLLANNARWGGGLLCYDGSNAVVVNCTFSQNSAIGIGGGVFADMNSSATLMNCILWNDTAPASWGPELALSDVDTGDGKFSAATLNYCDVQGGQAAVYVASGCTLTWAAGNLNADPLFVPADNLLHLSGLSPCIDAGNPAADYSGQVDIDGGSRVIHGIVDMGADEVPFGTLTLTTTPIAGEVSVNGVSWGTAPVTRDVPVGSYSVSFDDVAGYTTPGNQTATVFANQTTTVTGVYASSTGTGTLTVATNPVAGEIFVDNVSYGNSPRTLTIAVGSHTVSFGAVAGYTTPADETVTVAQDQITYAVGIYVASGQDTGTLSVDTDPVKGTVSVDGVVWGTAPQSQILPVGSHTVSFGAVAGYTTPTDQTVTVSKDQTTSVTGTYVASVATGTLTVATNPVAGEIFVDNVSWGTSPQSQTIAVGLHTVSFGAVTGYTTPADQTVTVVQNETKTVTGIYVAQGQDTGSLMVDTSPVKGDVFVDGLLWGTAPQTKIIPTGPHSISFGTVSGYITPADQAVTLQKGQVLSLTAVYVSLVGDTGTLTIDTTPVKGEVFVDGTSWGTAPQSKLIGVGSHTVHFGSVDNYTSPADQSVNVQKDNTTKVTGTYVALPPAIATLTIDTTPLKGDVFVDGVLWGKAPQSKKVNAGSHTISFGSVFGYVQPADQTVDVPQSQTMVVTGTYIRPSPPQFILTVTVSPEGSGTVEVTPDQDSFDLNTAVVLKPTAASGYYFDHWEGNLTGTANPANVTMYSDRSITAVFAKGTPKVEDNTSTGGSASSQSSVTSPTSSLCGLSPLVILAVLGAGLCLTRRE